jgi:hypothetical protein
MTIGILVGEVILGYLFFHSAHLLGFADIVSGFLICYSIFRVYASTEVMDHKELHVCFIPAILAFLFFFPFS